MKTSPTQSVFVVQIHCTSYMLCVEHFIVTYCLQNIKVRELLVTPKHTNL